ncbi:MAG: 5'/3'-nucleotidase SurE [Chloroflexi bacterium HGW-Chloroflexi-8]|nr:MAG: 5'/3'-nucleotidase SurE [Chloroflexi bacterium HGW-Chloroflexi-8]
MNILVTNDDGIGSSGILALAQAMGTIGNTFILAPDRNWSVSGHVKTLSRPLRVNPVTLKDDIQGWTSDGSPADCVTLGAHGFFNVPIHLVVSGINTTANVGQDITCSGTVTAAMEAAIHGIPAIAFSLDTSQLNGEKPDYESAAIWAKKVVEIALQHPFAPHSLLSVNIPALPKDKVKGFQVTRLGSRIYYDYLDRRVDPRGLDYVWISGKEPGGINEAGTDIGALAEGYVSVTPIHLDMTAYHLMDSINAWNWEQPEKYEINLNRLEKSCC